MAACLAWFMDLWLSMFQVLIIQTWCTVLQLCTTTFKLGGLPAWRGVWHGADTHGLWTCSYLHCGERAAACTSSCFMHFAEASCSRSCSRREGCLAFGSHSSNPKTMSYLHLHWAWAEP